MTTTPVTAREAEVLALLGRHLTNAEIAASLFISVRTVESHVAALMRKYELHDRRSLARVAAEHGLDPATPLPTPVTPFVGRVVERAELSEALSAHRLVTAVGPAGIGKTRLAIEVAGDAAGQRPDGVWFADLVRVTDPAAVISSVTEKVQAPEHSTASSEAALVSALARRKGILVLDNCEHLLDGVRDCVELVVTNCPEVTVLATSRRRLMLPYEYTYAVPGMSLADDGRGDAVELFITRVADSTSASDRPDASRVAALCRELDGMALAIELAAARYTTLGLDGLEAGLHQRLRYLTLGSEAAGRHRSLRETLDWSYQLLDPADQAVLRAASVFSAWFDVTAAGAVIAPDRQPAEVADALARLADHSLLIVDRGHPTRYRALETIRQYGAELLDAAGELVPTQARHAAWCRVVLIDLANASPDDAWSARFDEVVDDARAALVRTAAAPDEPAAEAADLAELLAGLLWLRGRLTEAQHRFEQAAGLSRSAEAAAPRLRSASGAAHTRFAGLEFLRLRRAAADVSVSIGDRRSACGDLAWMSLSISRSPGIMAEERTPAEATDLLTEARSLSDGSIRAEAGIAVAAAFWEALEPPLEQAQRALELARDSGDPALEDAALDLVIAQHLRLDDIPGALDAVRRRDDVVETLTLSPVNGFELSDHCLYASEVMLAAGDLPGAAHFAERLSRLPFIRDQDYLGLARRLKVDAFAGRFDDVVRDGERFRLTWELAGRPVVPNLAQCAYAVAMAHGIRGDHDGREQWRRITDDLIGDLRSPTRKVWTATYDLLVALHDADFAAAVGLASLDIDDPATWWRTGDCWSCPASVMLFRPWYAAAWAEAAVLGGLDDAPDRIRRARRAVRDNPIASAIVERAVAFAASDAAAVEDLAAQFEALGCSYQQQRCHTLAGLISAGAVPPSAALP